MTVILYYKDFQPPNRLWSYLSALPNQSGMYTTKMEIHIPYKIDMNLLYIRLPN